MNSDTESPVTPTRRPDSAEIATSNTTMKAIVCDSYGPPEALKVQETARPALEPDRVLVRVRAASINPADLHTIRGGLVIRLMNGWRRPKQPIPGADVAGTVQAVGESVTDLRPGDEVFGTCAGSLAEYGLGKKNLVPKPATVSFEQAGVVGIAGCTALQAVRDHGRLQPGQTVLVNGASGGVSTFAVQIAKALGGEVTAVCSTRNVELVRSLGADHVVDYTSTDFTRTGAQYDLTIDFVGNRALKDLRRSTKPGGTVILSGGGHERGHGESGLRPLVTMVRALLTSKFVKQRQIFFLAKIRKEDLSAIAEMMAAGKVTPVIDRTYPLRETGEAFAYLAAGHARGKIVIAVQDGALSE